MSLHTPNNTSRGKVFLYLGRKGGQCRSKVQIKVGVCRPRQPY